MEQRIRDYRDLIAWQRGRQLVKEVYLQIENLPKEELYGLTSQIKRAVVSIPSNIAEGYGRKQTRDYIRFLNIASGSCYEVETQLILCVDLGYLKEEQIQKSFSLLKETKKMLVALVKSLSSSDNRPF